LTNGQAYTFTVVATNSIGSSSASNTSNSVTPSAAATVPGAPTAVVATAGDVQASVAFVAPVSNGGSAITAYTVTSNPGAKTATGASSPLMVTGLTNGQAYIFTVVATNAIGNSAASTASVAVTPVAAAPVAAGVIATWDLVGVNTPTPVSTAAVTTKDAGLTVSNLTVASTLVAAAKANGDATGMVADADLLGAVGGFQTNGLAAAITDGTYLEFTITPATGKLVSITSIDVAAVGIAETINGACSLLSSKGGFTAGAAIQRITLGSANTTNIQPLIKLAVAGHDNLTVPVTFRFYFYGLADWGLDYSKVGIGNRDAANTTAALIVNGTVADDVPTTALSGSKDGNLMLYPNPATDNLSLNFGMAMEKAQVTILDLQGRSLMTRSVTNAQVETMNISSLSNGIYFVKVVADGKVMNSRFVKK